MSTHGPVKVGVSALLVPRQHTHPARYLDTVARPSGAVRLRAVLGLPARRTGRHRAEPMRPPTWIDAWRAVSTSAMLSGHPLDLRRWMEHQTPPDQRRAHRPGRHARPPKSAASRPRSEAVSLPAPRPDGHQHGQ